MFSLLRNRLGIPGIISVTALVFAMIGGAYAANDSGSGDATASAKQNKAGKRGPRGPKGKPGATGPAGPAGPGGATGPAGAAGAKGDKGDQGIPGSQGVQGVQGEPGDNGSNGTSVTSSTEPSGSGNCEGRGGSKFVAGASTTFACNGKEGEDGSPWTAGGTLPPGETETGAWTLVDVSAEKNKIPISFTIPLAADIVEGNAIYVKKDTTNASCDDGVAPAAGPAHPEADPGFLCVFNSKAGDEDSFEFEGIRKAAENGETGASTAGAVMSFFVTPLAEAAGTWAVTAPTP